MTAIVAGSGMIFMFPATQCLIPSEKVTISKKNLKKIHKKYQIT